MQKMLSVPSIFLFHILWHLLTAAARAQSDCEKDGDVSTYNLNDLAIPFSNLCGKDIEAPLDYFSSPEPRRSDCIDRCVKQAPLCYGFDYTPYVSSSQHNCWLMNGTFEASNATYRNFVADAAMLDPNLVVKLPRSCQRLSLRDCFEQNSQLLSSASSSAASTIASSSASTTEIPPTTAPITTPTSSGQTTGDSGGLSTGAKAGIGAGVGLLALIAILSGILLILKRMKRSRASTNSAILTPEPQRTSHRSVDPQQKVDSQTYAHMNASSQGLSPPNVANPASTVEQVHEIDGRPRHEK